MLVPGRYSTANDYRYGFNGKEKDNELKGEGNSYDYGMRMHDSRIGRFLSYDPLAAQFPYWSPYHFAGNSPIENVDLDGLENYNYRLLFDKDDKSYLKLIDIEEGDWCSLLTSQKVHYNGGTYNIHTEWNYAPHDGFKIVNKLEGLTRSEVANYFSKLKTDDVKEAEYKAQKEKDYQEFKDFAYGYYMAKGIKKNTYIKTKTPVEEKSVTITRVQTGHKDSQRIKVDKSGNVSIEGKNKLYVTIDDENHATYYYNKKGGAEGGASIITFQVKKEVADEIRKSAVPQAQARSHRDKPEQVDLTKSQSAYGLPANYIEKLEKGAIPGSATIKSP